MSEPTFKEQLAELNKQNEEALKAQEEFANAEKEQKEEQKKEEATVLSQLITYGHITAEDAKEWKENYDGKVFAVLLDKDESYVFRSIRYPEYQSIMGQLIKSSISQEEKEKLFDEQLCIKCLLHPKWSSEFKLTSSAGTIPTLSKQIQYASNFIPDDLALRLIRKL